MPDNPDNPQPQLVEEHRSTTAVVVIGLAPVAAGVGHEAGRDIYHAVKSAITSKPSEPPQPKE